MREVIITAKITEDGKLMVRDVQDYNQFLFDNSLSMVVIKMAAVSDADKKLSVWYFDNVIIPQYKSGLHKIGYLYTDEQTKEFIAKNCPYWTDDIEFQDTRYWSKINEWCSLSAAMDLNVDIKTE